MCVYMYKDKDDGTLVQYLVHFSPTEVADRPQFTLSSTVHHT